MLRGEVEAMQLPVQGVSDHHCCHAHIPVDLHVGTQEEDPHNTQQQQSIARTLLKEHCAAALSALLLTAA
jgi:hypothetical protein